MTTRWSQSAGGILMPADDGLDELGGDIERVEVFGVCRVCACTEDAPCILEGIYGDKPCSWANENHTLCTGCT